jgi:hypothetical protein
VENPAGVVDQLEGELTDLAREYGAGRLTKAEWQAAREGLDERLGHAQEAAAGNVTLTLPDRIDWSTLDLTTKRALVNMLLESVVIRPADRRHPPADRVDVTWKA